MSKVAMIGCGKLGMPCAEAMTKEYEVYGYDVNDVTSESVIMKDSVEEAVSDRDIIFIAVPTPHEKEYDGMHPTSHLPPKDFDYSIVERVLTEVNEYVDRSQLVVLISTVLPGTIRNRFSHITTNMRLIYNPYLIAMGSVSWDMVNPEMIIIGTENGEETGDTKELINFYETIMENEPRYEVGTWEEAESIKIFYNTWISTKVGLVNMMQDVAMKAGNMNVDVVTGALARSTQRITGDKYMTAGMGDGGSCHPRDNIALRKIVDTYDMGYDLFGAIMHAREQQAKNMADYVCSFELPVVIVGKTYKPNAPHTDGSSSTLVGFYVEEQGQDLYYFDPVLGEYPPEGLGQAVYLTTHSYDITYYKQKAGSEKANYNLIPEQGSVIVDPWRREELFDLYSDCEVVMYGNTRK